jgi:hypothetical protein
VSFTRLLPNGRWVYFTAWCSLLDDQGLWYRGAVIQAALCLINLVHNYLLAGENSGSCSPEMAAPRTQHRLNVLHTILWSFAIYWEGYDKTCSVCIIWFTSVKLKPYITWSSDVTSSTPSQTAHHTIKLCITKYGSHNTIIILGTVHCLLRISYTYKFRNLIHLYHLFMLCLIQCTRPNIIFG